MRSRWSVLLLFSIVLLPLLFGCASEGDLESSPSDVNIPEESPTAAIISTPTATPTPEPVWSYITNANYGSRIAEDLDGNIWGVGSGGVVKWDADTGNYVKFTRADGLLSNSARNIAITTDGAVWVGMSGGIARYEQEQWTTFTTDDGLITNSPLVLAADPNGGLWAGFIGGVSFYDGTTWSSYSVELLGERFAEILVTNEGQVWVGSDEGVSLYEDGEWSTFKIGAKRRLRSTIDYELETEIRSITQAADGSIWFGTGTGGARHKDGVWTYFTDQEGLDPRLGLRDIAFDGTGVPWGVNRDSGVFQYISGWWRFLTQDDGVPDVHFNKAEAEPGGGVWFGSNEGTDGGALLVRYPNFMLLNEENGGLGSGSITDILSLDDGSTWFAHYGAGLSRLHLEDGTLSFFRTQDQLPNNFISHFAIGPDGTLWLGNQLASFDGQEWNDFSDNEILSPSEFPAWTVAMEFSDDGTLWLGQRLGPITVSGREGLFLLVSWDGETWETHGRDGEVMEGGVTDIDFASDGSVWVQISNHGVAHYSGDEWESFSSEEGFSTKDPNCLVVDHDDVVWVGTGDVGLMKYDGETWERVANADVLLDTNIISLFADDSGKLWVGTDVGLMVFDGSSWEVYRSEDGLADDKVLDIEKAPDGSLWIATNHGVSRFHQGNWQTYTIVDGLGMNSVSDIEIAPDGSLWFTHPVGGGISRYGPAQ